MMGDRNLPLMLMSGTQWMLCWLLHTQLLAGIRAEPCAHLYLPGLDSTTTIYPQLAGVYKLQPSPFSEVLNVSNADLQ